MKQSMFSEEAAKRQRDQIKKSKDNSLQVQQDEEKRPGLVRVNITMSEETKRKLDILAKKYETTASQLIRSLIIEKYDE